MLFTQALSSSALKNSSKAAFHYLDKNISYKEYWDTANRYSYYLQKEMGHSLRVGLWMSNCPHFAYSFIALSNTKSLTVPLNPFASLEENLFKIKDAEINYILCSSDQTKAAKDFLFQNGLSHIPVMDIESKRCGEYDPSYTPPASHVPKETDEVLLLYTPGTTGRMKGCLFDHKSIAPTLTSLRNGYKANATDVFYTNLQYNLTFAFIHFLIMPLSAGSAVFISDERDSKIILQNLTKNKVTRFAPIPTVMPDLLSALTENNLTIPTVKHFVFYGQTLSIPIWQELKEKTSAEVLNVYGMTEALASVAISTPEHPANLDQPMRIGPVFAGTKTRVVDDNNDEIEKKKPQCGQLLVMASQVMKKYLKLPDEQKQTMRGTWLFTGDFVEIDSDSGIIFYDRKADIIITPKGSKVFPRDIEPIVREISKITECAYISVKNKFKKPTVALVVVKTPQTELTDRDILDYLKDKIQEEQLPEHILFTDHIPKTMSGAINRSKLRMLYAGI